MRLGQNQIQKPLLDILPRHVEVDSRHGHLMWRHGKSVNVVVLPHSCVEKHAFGAVVVWVRTAVAVAFIPLRMTGELRHVGVKLIEVGGLEGLAVIDAARLVKFRVQDDLPVRMFQGDVGDHLGQVRPRIFRHWIPQPFNVLRVKPTEPMCCQVGAVEVADKRLEKRRQPLFNCSVKPLIQLSQGVFGLLDGRGLEDEAANAEQESVKSVVAVDANAAEHAHVGFDEGYAGHPQRRTPCCRGELGIHPGRTGHADEDGLEDLVGGDVGREFVVGAHSDALLEPPCRKGRGEFQLAADGSHRLGDSLVIAMQALLQEVHGSRREHLGQKLGVAVVVVDVHPNLLVELKKLPRVAKQVVEVGDGDLATLRRVPLLLQIFLARFLGIWGRCHGA